MMPASATDFALDLQQEPYEGILHVRICAGGSRQRLSRVRRLCRCPLKDGQVLVPHSAGN